MDTLNEYLDTPITLKEVIFSPIVWMSALCGFLLYKLYNRTDPSLSQKVQSQQGGVGNQQHQSDSRKFLSDNQYNHGNSSDSSTVGVHIRRAEGNAQIRIGKSTVNKVTLPQRY